MFKHTTMHRKWTEDRYLPQKYRKERLELLKQEEADRKNQELNEFREWNDEGSKKQQRQAERENMLTKSKEEQKLRKIL